MDLTVVKVGGGLLGVAGDLERLVAALVTRRRRGERLLVVVSALKGVTDALDQAAKDALDARSGGELVRDFVERLEGLHLALVADDRARNVVRLRLRTALDGVERLLTGMRLTGEVTDRTLALLLAHGERLAAPLLAEALRVGGADARAVSAEEAGLVAVGPHRVGRCDLAATRERLLRLPHELHDRILVLTGFYGVSAAGDVVLFGRGGTDYTAGVVAALLEAEALELWKDVPGFMSADPRVVQQARLVPELSFAEACELGYYGARILHPRCLEPLRGTRTAVSLRPVGEALGLGTRIVERRGGGPAVAALAHRSGVALVRVEGAAMVGVPGVAGQILAAVGAEGADVQALAASMTSVSFTVDEHDLPLARRALRRLHEAGAVAVERESDQPGMALLGIVGDAVARSPVHAARALRCLAQHEIAVELLSHGPGDVGWSCVLPQVELARALAVLHGVFFGAPVEEVALT